MEKWRTYIFDNYIENIKLCCLGESYNSSYISKIDFDREELDYINSNIDLTKFLKTKAPLIKLLENREYQTSYSFIILKLSKV